MQLASIIAIYFVVWWLSLFMVLPFFVTNQSDTGEIVPGTEPGAPVVPRLGRKMAVTSVLALGLTALLVWGLENPALQAYWS